MNMDSSFVHTNGRLETPQMSIRRGMDKLWYTLIQWKNLRNKKDKLLICAATWMNLKYILVSKRNHIKKSVCHMISCMKL